ncbi:MAG: bacteriohemerythrin [Bryobacteraceae bacterium]|jgi:hemerythrin
MAFVEWKPAYSVGVPAIDEQHRGLLDIINRVHEMMKRGGVPPELKSAVQALVSYTRHHFAYEEQMLRSSGYPELDEHKRKHLAMAAQVEGFRLEVARGKTSAPLNLMGFLKDWFTEHILETDMRYSAHMAGRLVA